MGMSYRQLARALGIGKSAVGKNVAAGMPTDLEGARAWRKGLDVSRSAAGRIDRPGPAAAPTAAAGAGADAAVRQANDAGRRCLAAPADADALVQLRQALRAVPDAVRERVELDLAVWDQLMGQAVTTIDVAGLEEAPPAGAELDELCWALATGRIRLA